MRIVGVCLSAAGACVALLGGISMRQASLRATGKIAADEAWALQCILTVVRPLVPGSGASSAVTTARIATWTMCGAVVFGFALLVCGIVIATTEHDNSQQG